ncbi:glycosyltransferase family 1 protein [Microbacterium aoyamense]|uniref:Glycosyltransferase family 1 protein n=1 Tax=Microbacterium aoyamense TaxID=344166 RepID=A0ABN2PEE2_9MICO|nr:glycosyltransferase family 1 protein [Microbacterium aoyamense]
MSRLALVTFASETVMGAQVYERAIDSRAKDALGTVSDDWAVQSIVVRSLRSPLAGTHRLPIGWLARASAGSRAAAARLIYPRADLVHRMKVSLPPAPGRDILTLHDIGPWKFPDEAVPPRAAREELLRARAIVTPSAFSAAEIVEMFGVDDPVVIPNGFDRERFDGAEPLSAEALQGLGVHGDFVVAAGGASRRKNLAGLAEAWPIVRRARPNLTLALAGPRNAERDRLFAGLDGVVLVGRLPDAVVPGFLAAAKAIVVPSLYEGFGLPALEAMAVGVPVVAMRASSLPEVVGDAGILVDPTPQALAEGVIWATSNEADLQDLIARGKTRAAAHSWERSAAEHARLWARLV